MFWIPAPLGRKPATMLHTAFILALSTAKLPFLAGTSHLRSLSRRQVATLSAVSMSTGQAGGMRFIDIGANLLDDSFQGRYNGGSQKHEPDLDAVLDRAAAAGVEKVIVLLVCYRRLCCLRHEWNLWHCCC